MASLGCTVLLRMMSDISRLRAISSSELDVARSIWASSSVLLEPPNQDAMVAVDVCRASQGGRSLSHCCCERMYVRTESPVVLSSSYDW